MAAFKPSTWLFLVLGLCFGYKRQHINLSLNLQVSVNFKFLNLWVPNLRILGQILTSSEHPKLPLSIAVVVGHHFLLLRIKTQLSNTWHLKLAETFGSRRLSKALLAFLLLLSGILLIYQYGKVSCD